MTLDKGERSKCSRWPSVECVWRRNERCESIRSMISGKEWSRLVEGKKIRRVARRWGWALLSCNAVCSTEYTVEKGRCEGGSEI